MKAHKVKQGGIFSDDQQDGLIDSFKVVPAKADDGFAKRGSKKSSK